VNNDGKRYDELTQFDHVRLSRSEDIPQRYRGTIGQVARVYAEGSADVYVQRRKYALSVWNTELTKVKIDPDRVFKLR